MSEADNGVWREPPEESIDVYPGLTVWDDRVSGSITTGRSRLPIWCFIFVALTDGWKEVEDNWPTIKDHAWDADKMGSFLADLFQARGEFARLILMIANGERIERENDQLDQPWWRDRVIARPIINQLQRCIDALELASNG